MAVFRTISNSFWTDSKVDDTFTPEDKYFYLYLLTNPHTNICGCYEISNKQMSRETGYNEDTIKRLIERFEKVHDVIRYNPDTKEMLILNWHKYNWTKSEKLKTAVEKVIGHIKCQEYAEYIHATLYDDTVSIPYRYGMDTNIVSSPIISNTNTKELNTNNKDNSPIRDYKDVDKVIEEYNRICKSLTKCMRATKKRRDKIATRLKDYTLDDFVKAFEMSEQSDFLSGRKTEWRASLDWFIQNEDNLAKVLEGRYVETKTGNAEAEGHSSGDSEFYEDLPDVW